MAKRAKFLWGSVEEQMRAVPVKNARVARVDGPGPGQVSLEVELKYGRLRWLSRLLKARKRKTIILEGLALEVYDRLDGQATLGDLVDWFMREHWLTFFEARGLAVNYLHLLTQRGLAAVMVPRAQGAEGGP